MANLHQVSKFLSLLLRHKPEILGLTIDNEGFCNIPLKKLVDLIRQQPKFSDLQVQDIITLVAKDSKGRYQIIDDRIRALYGHSIPVTLLNDNILTVDEIPEILYHGTSKNNLDSIFSVGLKSGNRIYVHLSDNLDTAISVGKRHTSDPMIIKITAKKLVKDGFSVKKVGKGTYITNSINPTYLSLLEK